MTQASERLRTRLAESGRFKVVDIAPVIKESRASNLQACGGCDVTLAERIGADLSITGTVYKVSNLILNMMIFVRDAKTGDNVAVMQAEMRGDTDDSWLRAVDWLVRNRLLAVPERRDDAAAGKRERAGRSRDRGRARRRHRRPEGHLERARSAPSRRTSCARP